MSSSLPQQDPARSDPGSPDGDSPPKPWLFDQILDAISRISLVIAGIGLVVLTVNFGWLVYGRYVLNATPTWVEQVSLLLVMLITFLGAAVGLHEGTHLGVSYFQEIVPAPIRRVFQALSYFTLAGFGSIMAWHSGNLVVFKWGSDIPLIHVPEGLRAIPIAICGVLMVLFSLGHLLRLARGIETEVDLEHPE